MRLTRTVGRYVTVQLNGEKIVLHGSLKLAIFAGLSMEPFARDKCRKAGRRRFNYVNDVKCFDRCYLLFETARSFASSIPPAATW